MKTYIICPDDRVDEALELLSRIKKVKATKGGTLWAGSQMSLQAQPIPDGHTVIKITAGSGTAMLDAGWILGKNGF